jgi:spore germination protein
MVEERRSAYGKGEIPMFIHRVMGRASTRQVAELYGTTTRELLRLNEVETEDDLIDGLHLLVPGETYLAVPYTIQRGDTVENIATRVGLPPQYIERWTGIYRGTGPLATGTTIYIPRRIARKNTIETNAFLIPEGDANDTRLLYDIHDLTYVSIFSFQVQNDGTVRAPNDAYALRAAKQLTIKPMMTVTNFTGYQFDSRIIETISRDSDMKNRIAQSIIRLAKERGYEGVVIDFEQLRAEDRERYTRLVTDWSAAFKRENLVTAIVLPPMSADVNEGARAAYDYRALGNQVDFVILMTYEWGWAGGPPMTNNLPLFFPSSTTQRCNASTS